MIVEEVVDGKIELDGIFNKVHVENICPFCGVKKGMYETDLKYHDSMITVGRECIYCDSHWYEIYQLTGVRVPA